MARINNKTDHKDKFKIYCTALVGDDTSPTILNQQRVFISKFINKASKEFLDIKEVIQAIRSYEPQ